MENGRYFISEMIQRQKNRDGNVKSLEQQQQVEKKITWRDSAGRAVSRILKTVQINYRSGPVRGCSGRPQDVESRNTGLDCRRIRSLLVSDPDDPLEPEFPPSLTRARESAPVHIRLIGLAWADAGLISSPHEMTEPWSLSPPSSDADDLLL